MYEIDKYKKDERLYKMMEDIGKTGKMLKEPDEDYKLEKNKVIRIVDHQAMPRMAEDEIEPLKIISSNVVGNIFDRVIFLEERIAEIRKNVATREKLHNAMIEEIEKDIEEKTAMVSLLSDPNERRNLKLDISVLRKEKRHEDVQFWKDLMELNTELKTLMEEYEAERKIASIFENIKEKEGA
jgi:hypothetical protein